MNGIYIYHMDDDIYTQEMRYVNKYTTFFLKKKKKERKKDR
jgi:hypothetical protein